MTSRDVSNTLTKGAPLLVGTGIFDITGPAAGVGMMGFAVASQRTAGIHLRLRSRAFIIGDGQKRVVIVCADLGMLFQSLKLGVCERIAADPALAPHYDERNVLLSATHTHGGPGGYSGYLLYDLSIKGFIKRHFDAIVDGIYQSIARAHDNLEPGHVFVSRGTLQGVGQNRAVDPYCANPAEERALYSGNTDQTMTLLKLVSAHGEELGTINWYAVHPDSIGDSNTLITGDNKGYAAYLLERDKRTDYAAPKTFVAAFAQANSGDVTPNIGFGQAPSSVRLEDNPSLCNAVLGQYGKAKELYASAAEPVTGPVDFRHEWVDMRSLFVASARTATCAAAMGASFSAGSPADNDSPVPLFQNGTTNQKLSQRDRAVLKLFQSAFGVLSSKSRDGAYRAAQGEKPVLMPTGMVELRGQSLVPQILPLQIVRIGQVAIAAIPSEVTTMAGRRIKRLLESALQAKYPVVAALANSYGSYLTTREEYAQQWYEGASTPFGPHQLAGFEQELRKLCDAITSNTQVDAGPRPPVVIERAFARVAPPTFDRAPPLGAFGDVREQPKLAYTRGELVMARFWSANPNNDYRAQRSFLAVEKRVNGSFVAVAWDADPEALFRWRRVGVGRSEVTITWETSHAEPGVYRIRHMGDAKPLWSRATHAFEGVTREFSVR